MYYYLIVRMGIIERSKSFDDSEKRDNAARKWWHENNSGEEQVFWLDLPDQMNEIHEPQVGEYPTFEES